MQLQGALRIPGAALALVLPLPRVDGQIDRLHRRQLRTG